MTREEIIDGMGWSRIADLSLSDMLERIERLVAVAEAREREACAQVCESLIVSEYRTGKVGHNERGWTELCASKIRARRDKP